jgi:hypothetical protein
MLILTPDSAINILLTFSHAIIDFEESPLR